MTSHPASAGPMELKAQIDKLSTDLVEVYEALTMVYGSVAVLGGLFAFEEITGYLVERSVDALLASGAALYLAQQDGTLTCVAQHEGLAAHIASHGPRALLDKRRAMFHNGEAAATVLTAEAPRFNLVSSPLETGGKARGVLVVARPPQETFATGDAKLIGALCGVTAVAIANFQHYRAVSAQREMLEGVMRESAEGIVVADAHWNAKFANAAARGFLGAPGTESFDALARLDAFELDRPRAAIRGGAPDAQEFLAQSADPRRPLVLRCKALDARFGADGEPVHVLFLHDVTREHREAEAQRDFLSLASHKLRTPLTCILGMLPMAETGDDALRAEALRDIGSSAEQLRALVDGILQFVEFKSGPRVEQDVRLDALAHEAFAEVMGRRPDKRPRLDLEVEAKLPTVRGSRLQLRTLLLHVLDNAVRFDATETPVVTARIGAVDGDRVRIQVSDHGDGMAPELVARLFQPFAQRDEEFTGQADGAGFGLLLAHQVVVAHGGTLRIDSTLHQGTTVVVEIPTRLGERRT
jgi:signal transduction histidine kinase